MGKRLSKDARNVFAVLLSVAVLIGVQDSQSSAAAQTADAPVADQQPLIHAATGFRFPARIGTFQRESAMRRYDSEGRDVSVGYNSNPHAPDFVAMTVYVYPAPPVPAGTGADASLDEEFRRVEREVMTKDRFAHMLYEQAVTVDPALPSPAKRAVFAVSPASWGPSFSEALLFRAGNWFVLYRASYQQSCAVPCADRTKQFVLALKWPDSLLKDVTP